MELTDYIRILRKNWVIIVVATLVGIGVAAAWSLTRTPQYEASSTVFVSTQSGSTIQELQQGSTFTQSRVQTYSQLVKTPIVMGPVIAELELGTTAEALGAQVSASAALNTTLITITVTNSDPVKSAEIANALAASLTSAVDQIESVTNADGSTSSPVRLSRVKDAIPPLEASSPNVPLNLALGALVGLALGIGVAVLRAVLDTRIRTPRDVEALTERPMIGAIAFDPKAKERPLIVHADPLSPRAESFRAMRTNLQFLDVGERSSFVITSSLPTEGKSTTTINLAIALADAGKRVALLDTDLRKPKVAEYLGIEGGVGLTDVLIGRTRIGDVMLPWGGRQLYVLPAGKIPPNPSELLGSERMRALLEVLERDFDVVLCDAPPLLPVTDGAILAKATGGAIVIVAAGKTNRQQLSGALDALDTVGAHVAGIAMTMVPTRGPDSYAYGYGYGAYGYVDDSKNVKDGKAEKHNKAAKPTKQSKPQEPGGAGPVRSSTPSQAPVVERPSASSGTARREEPRPAVAERPLTGSETGGRDDTQWAPQPAQPAATQAASSGNDPLTIDDIIRQAGGPTRTGRSEPPS
ncbi:polysaccharide biosynthesis tyrosine autokinase [Microbacterium yannicii]|uniref:polysaccharide biosynthesis tyrosine autokinase n=1 Tax=Microbacterium yannicii TaxID=671622 RepID=UPI0002DA7C3F|nr:polysaccharide biosynthesis tyrosine autokinase [Microbacterium yannicii]